MTSLQDIFLGKLHISIIKDNKEYMPILGFFHSLRMWTGFLAVSVVPIICGNPILPVVVKVGWTRGFGSACCFQQLICQSQCWTIPTQPVSLKSWGKILEMVMPSGSWMKFIWISFTQDSDLYMMEIVLLSLVDDLSQWIAWLVTMQFFLSTIFGSFCYHDA